MDSETSQKSALSQSQAESDWEVQSHTNRAPEDTQVLKQGDTFAILDRFGEMGLPGQV